MIWGLRLPVIFLTTSCLIEIGLQSFCHSFGWKNRSWTKRIVSFQVYVFFFNFYGFIEEKTLWRFSVSQFCFLIHPDHTKPATSCTEDKLLKEAQLCEVFGVQSPRTTSVVWVGVEWRLCWMLIAFDGVIKSTLMDPNLYCVARVGGEWWLVGYGVVLAASKNWTSTC